MKKRIVLKLSYFLAIGIFVFVCLYILATVLYPGGSENNRNAQGFDWLHNYWCTMFDAYAINGKLNRARPLAIASMVVLWLDFLVFFYLFSEVLARNKIWRMIIKISSIMAVLSASFLYTRLHDLVTSLASFFGVFTILGIVICLYKSDLKLYKISGILCICLLGINNYIYYSENFIAFLPLIQKITFLLVLLWMFGLNRVIFSKNKILILQK
ncbi:MAG: hypothetical protein JXA77_11220 [Bacteroidales bacterium]|nr:hypothetical protein [Bacteroidales bacterium]MBN2819063.1 hypothetical protein [Bacteroidales bacterium]